MNWVAALAVASGSGQDKMTNAANTFIPMAGFFFLRSRPDGALLQVRYGQSPAERFRTCAPLAVMQRATCGALVQSESHTRLVQRGMHG